MTKYKNLDRFKAWLDQTLKCPHGVYDLDAVLADVVRSHGITGTESYELAAWETKSGHAEVYCYEYEHIWDEEADQLIEETFIF